MPRPRELDPGESPLALFGAELRHYRLAAELSQEQLGERTSYSAALVGAVETARRMPTEEFAQRCDAALQTGGALRRLRERLKDYLKHQAYPAWFRGWPTVEAEAVVLGCWEPMVVPGLLQTQAYARAVLRTRVMDTREQIEELVAARMSRQEILARDEPPMLWVVIDEAVLRRPVGGPDVMRGQLDHLGEVAQRTRIVLQVVPMSVGAHEGLRGAFVIAELDSATSIVYQDTAVSGQIVERAEDVAVVQLTWDTLRAEALSRTVSLELIEEVAKSWS